MEHPGGRRRRQYSRHAFRELCLYPFDISTKQEGIPSVRNYKQPTVYFWGNSDHLTGTSLPTYHSQCGWGVRCAHKWVRKNIWIGWKYHHVYYCENLWWGQPLYSRVCGWCIIIPCIPHSHREGPEALSCSIGIDHPHTPVTLSLYHELCMAGMWYRNRF